MALSIMVSTTSYIVFIKNPHNINIAGAVSAVLALLAISKWTGWCILHGLACIVNSSRRPHLLQLKAMPADKTPPAGRG